MFRTNWKKWALTAMVSAALLPAATFAKTHRAATPAKQSTVAKTATTTDSKDKKKLTHKTAPAKKLVHRTTPSKKLVAKTHAAKKLSSKRVAPAKLTHKSAPVSKKLTSKTAHQTARLSTHKKIQLDAKGKTLKA